MIDLICVVLHGIVIFGTVYSYPHEDVRWYAIFGVLIMWVKLFYWMRIFEDTSGFMRMLLVICKLCIPFTIMTLICIGMFANANMIIDQIRKGKDPEAEMSNEYAVGSKWIDALIHTYNVGLSNEERGGMAGEHQNLVWLLYFICTVVLELVFFNQLIAIMGDAYGKMSEV